MGYLDKRENQMRIKNVRKIMVKKNLDAILIYYDEFNIGNGWYLTGWCPQFESGAVLVPREGAPLILGGPESEPFAKLDSAINDTRNFPVFMVPNEEYPNATITDFKALFIELKSRLEKLHAIGLVGDVLAVNGNYTSKQNECIKHLKEAFFLTKEALVPGKTGREIDAPARAYFKRTGFSKYLVCPFVHTIGLHEAESPFFGPNSDDVLQPGMTVCVDISFFGHPEFNGARIETGYEISNKGIFPLSLKMDSRFTAD